MSTLTEEKFASIISDIRELQLKRQEQDKVYKVLIKCLLVDLCKSTGGLCRDEFDGRTDLLMSYCGLSKPVAWPRPSRSARMWMASLFELEVSCVK